MISSPCAIAVIRSRPARSCIARSPRTSGKSAGTFAVPPAGWSRCSAESLPRRPAEFRAGSKDPVSAAAEPDLKIGPTYDLKGADESWHDLALCAWRRARASARTKSCPCSVHPPDRALRVVARRQAPGRHAFDGDERHRALQGIELASFVPLCRRRASHLI